MKRIRCSVTLALVAVAATACGFGDSAEAPHPSNTASTIATQSLPAFTPPVTTTWDLPPQQFSTAANAPTRLPAGTTVDRSDPTSVALAAAQIWFGWDTTADTSPYQAALRTAPLLTDKCVARLTSSPPAGAPGQDWTALALVHARAQVDAEVGAEDQPRDSQDRAVRLLTVTQRWIADKPTPPRRVIAQVALAKDRQDGQWAVTSDADGRCGVVIR